MELVHPVLGTATILAAAWVMTRGLTARTGSKKATNARRVHKRWAPWVFAAMLTSGLSGTASTYFLRDDLTLGETWHLAVGWLAIGVMGVAGLLTRAFTRNPTLRNVHPWIGVGSVALAILQGILGIELLP